MSKSLGLSSAQAEKNLKKFGQNVIEEGKKKNIFVLFLEQFQNFLVLLLLFAAVFSLALGEVVEGSLILAIVILNALFGVYQEQKAEKAIDALKNMTSTMVRVIRDGNETVVDSKFVVPGDVIKIEEGNKIAADGRIISSLHLEVNESALTGESIPVTKDKDDEVAAGTIVTKGRATVEVVSTGMKTQFGQIAANLSSVKETKTPLQRKLTGITKVLGAFGILSSVLVFVLSYMLTGDGLYPSILLGISIAVAIVPEGLPAVLTVTLAIGVRNMADRKAIMRNLSSIEALGNITLIATDKTGTLTTNVMRVKEAWLNKQILQEEQLKKNADGSDTPDEFRRIVTDGVVCSTASLSYDDEKKQKIVIGDPTEGALLYLAEDMGKKPEELRDTWNLIEEMPFDSVTKRMMVLVQQGDETITYAKGAPESILEISSSLSVNGKITDLDDEARKEITDTLHQWAEKGLRVLAFSQKVHDSHDSPKLRQKPDDHVFLGMVAIHDAPRPEAREAVERARDAGIRSVMITGDNEKTAEAVGRFVGIYHDGDTILTGKQLDTYDDKKLKEVLPNVSVFARTTPFHKSRLVKLYQELGEIVASTGDGVNDAIALKQADVGVAMGLVGTDVTREAADMVITDDNFKTIVNAVEEGRNIIRNIRNVMKYLLSTNAVEVFVLVGGLLLGIPHIVNALMLLFINLVTDGVPALLLAFAPRDPDVMKQQSTKKLSLLRKIDYEYIIAVTGIGFIVFFAAFFNPFVQDDNARRMIVFCVLVLVQTFTYADVWVSHHPLQTSLGRLKSRYFLSAFSFALLLQLVVATVPPIANAFKVGPISLGTYGLAVLYASSSLIILEGIKTGRLVLLGRTKKG